MNTLLRKGVIRDAAGELNVYLHKVVLFAGREDRLAQSEQDYRICIDYRLLNKVSITNNYPVPDLEACVRHV